MLLLSHCSFLILRFSVILPYLPLPIIYLSLPPFFLIPSFFLWFFSQSFFFSHSSLNLQYIFFYCFVFFGSFLTTLHLKTRLNPRSLKRGCCVWGWIKQLRRLYRRRKSLVPEGERHVPILQRHLEQPRRWRRAIQNSEVFPLEIFGLLAFKLFHVYIPISVIFVKKK